MKILTHPCNLGGFPETRVEHTNTMPATGQRRSFGYFTATLGVAGATVAAWSVRAHIKADYASLLYLLVIVACATTTGRGPAVLAAVLSFLGWNFFFIEPIGTFTVHDPKEWFALVVFLIIGVLCAVLGERARVAGQVEALRETGKLKSALLSSVSHDLRTPLASIKAAVTGLLQNEAPAPASQRELLLSINDATDVLNNIVGDLLDLSRIEAGAWEPGREPNDLSEVIGTVLERFDEANNARIHVDLPADLPPVPMDFVSIAQVLWNLLDNALKYSPPSKPVRMTARNDGASVVVTVSDEGSGVPVTDRLRIFDKFYRAQRHVERQVLGTGMGLAICKGIVEGHGGRIWVRETSATGATFCFMLPLTPHPPLPALGPSSGRGPAGEDEE